MKLAVVIALLSLLAILNFSISTLVIATLLGLLFIPPLLLFASVFIEGTAAMCELLESEKERFVISIAKKSIILEPNLNR